MQHCEQCGGAYGVERSTSDYRFLYCTGLCQRNAGVVAERDILTAHRSTFTPSEKARLAELLHREGPLHEGS